MAYLIHLESKIIFDRLIGEERVKKYLNSLQAYDIDTYEHSLRVGMLSIDLGYENIMSNNNLGILGYSGLLHDIGKIRIPHRILLKTSPLNEEEKRKIRSHPRFGFLELFDFDYPSVREVVVSHHEFKVEPYSRSGKERREISRNSPEKRRSNSRILELGAIIAVADMFDALASPRAYKSPLPKERIKAILHQQYTGNRKYIDQVIERYNSSSQ